MSHRLQVLIPEELDTRLGQAAERKRLSKGAFVRSAIETALDAALSSQDPLDDLAALEAPTGDLDRMLAEIDEGRQ